MKLLAWTIFAVLLFLVIFQGISQFSKPKAIDSTPPTSPTPPKPAPKIYGVNISGAEFGESSIPGVMNADYIYPKNGAEYRYFVDKGITVIRLPIRWERIQRKAFGELHTPDINEIKKVLEVANQHNMKVILDLHNFGRYYGATLSTQDANKLADVWVKLALVFKGDPGLYGYELMNEPHTLPGGSKTWAQIAEHTTAALRKVDRDVLIIIPGYNWQNAQNWAQNNSYFPINDPGNNTIYAAHIYFDSTYHGRYTKSFDEDNRNLRIGITQSADFRDWLKVNNVKGIFTEFGVPDSDPRWLTTMDLFLESIHTDTHITGAIYWSAGPWWGKYALSVEPRDGADRPQIGILQKYTKPTVSN